MQKITPSILKKVIKKRKKQSHKGDYGLVLIIAGSEEYAGASVLVAKAVVNAVAALRSGVDLVTVAAPEKVGWLMHTYLPDVIIKKFKCGYFTEKHANKIIDLAKNKDAIIIGPGLGRKSDKFVRKIIRKVKNLVIDADALKSMKIKDAKGAILTPHKTEFKLLSGKTLPKNLKEKIRTVKQYAKNNVILLKGNPDIIAYKNKVRLNYTGNPAMTVGGTGDVLAGLCAGFLAQSKDKFNSSCAAAFINGKAGDIVQKKIGNGLIASDLLPEISKIIKKYINK